MEEERFIKESLRVHGVKKAPEDLLSNVMQVIDSKEQKQAFRPLMAPWLLKTLLFISATAVLFLLFGIKDSGGEAIVNLPEWNFQFPALNFHLPTLVLPSFIAVFLLVLADGLSHWNKRVL